MANATPLRKPPALVSAGASDTLWKDRPATQSPATPKTAMPPIFRKAMKNEKDWMKRLLRMFTRKANENYATPSPGTSQSAPPVSNSCNVYVPKVRATRLSLMTMEKYINNAQAPVIVVLP